MRSEELRCCTACGQRTPQRFCYSKWGYDIVRCGECGLGSTVLEKNFDPAGVYNESYFAGGRRDGYADYVGSEKVLRREFSVVLRAILASGAARGKLVEIGCAYGYFLHVARSRFDVFGLDLCAEAVQFARAAGLDVVCGPASEEVFADKGPFDVAVMLDVIEHLPKRAEVLTLIHRHLSAEGRLVLTTRDWGAPVSRLMGGAWRLMTPPAAYVLLYAREHVPVARAYRL